jgi:hypothetical protein
MARFFAAVWRGLTQLAVWRRFWQWAHQIQAELRTPVGRINVLTGSAPTLLTLAVLFLLLQSLVDFETRWASYHGRGSSDLFLGGFLLGMILTSMAWLMSLRIVQQDEESRRHFELLALLADEDDDEDD